MLVQDVMSERLVCCMPGHNLQEAAYKMLIADCGMIPVVNDLMEKKLLGVLTDRDIVCRAIVHGNNPLSTRVDECMSHEIVSVAAESPLDLCCQLMRKYQLRRVLVVDTSGRCCGVVSLSDIARFLPQEVGDVVQMISLPYAPSLKAAQACPERAVVYRGSAA